MMPSCILRKRIWEVDCFSMDAVLASCFDWRELANFLQSAGHCPDLTKSANIVEMQVQCLAHQFCHSENPFSIRIEGLLNRWHESVIEHLSSMSRQQIVLYLTQVPLEENLGGFFWALGSDGRDRFDCVRRRFHQRVQVFSLRRLKTVPEISNGKEI